MTSKGFIRWSGAAAVLAGLLGIAGSFFVGRAAPPVALEIWVLAFTTLATYFALFGVYLYQRRGAGVLGLIGLVVTVVGNTLWFLPGFPILAGSFYALGLIILAVASLRAGMLPRWVPALWIAAPVLGVPGFFLESIAGASYIAAGIAYGSAFIGAGWILWSGRAAQA